MRPCATENLAETPTEQPAGPAGAETLEREKLLVKNLNTGFAVSVVNGLVLAFFLAPRSDAALVGAWLGVIFATNFIRCIIARRISAGDKTLRPGDLRWIIANTALSGICWGASPFLILEPAPHAEHFAIFMIAGMTAAASLSYATHLTIVISFNASALGALFIFYIAGGEHADYALSGILILYLAGTIRAPVRRNNYERHCQQTPCRKTTG